MKAAKQNLYIEQGATWILPLTWVKRVPGVNPDDPPAMVPEPLDAYRARMHIRKKLGAPILVEAYSYPTDSQPDPRITWIDAAAGKFQIQLEEADTDLLNVTEAVYDLEMVDDSRTPPRVIRLLEGLVEISPNVTREES